MIGREPWEMRVHTTARVMNACRESLWSIYCGLVPRKKKFCCKIVSFIKNSVTIIVMKLRKKKKNKKMGKETKREQESFTWLNEKGAKTLRSVAAFISKAEWNNETAPKSTK